jgi:hypothetical protein
LILEWETGLEPATSSLGIQASFESETLARFCCEFLNLQHLAESVFSDLVRPIEAQMRQTYAKVYEQDYGQASCRDRPFECGNSLRQRATANRLSVDPSEQILKRERIFETSMRNLRRRIEGLEKSNAGKQHCLQAIAEAALEWLQPDLLEPFISAYGADRVGRRLTEREAVARRAFTGALERECQSAGLQSIQGCMRTAYIRRAIVMGLARRVSPEALKLAESALHASMTGDPPTEAESAALRACQAEHQRLFQLAGFGSVGK